MIKPYYIKGVHRVKKKQHLFKDILQIVVPASFAKFTGKHLFYFLMKLQA